MANDLDDVIGDDKRKGGDKMLDLGIALGIWGAIIVIITILGKLLGRPIIDGAVLGTFIALIALMMILHPFLIVDGVYQPQYGDSIVGIIIAVSALVVLFGLFYFFYRIGKFRCCCGDEQKVESVTNYTDLYTDSLV